jgi:hypothetical protein
MLSSIIVKAGSPQPRRDREGNSTEIHVGRRDREGVSTVGGDVAKEGRESEVSWKEVRTRQREVRVK